MCIGVSYHSLIGDSYLNLAITKLNVGLQLILLQPCLKINNDSLGTHVTQCLFSCQRFLNSFLNICWSCYEIIKNIFLPVELKDHYNLPILVFERRTLWIFITYLQWVLNSRRTCETSVQSKQYSENDLVYNYQFHCSLFLLQIKIDN